MAIADTVPENESSCVATGRKRAIFKVDQAFGAACICAKCFDTGYRGRTGIYEMMVLNDEIRDMVCSRQSAGVIKKKALAYGMQTLRMDGNRKVQAGITTIAEVLRVTQSDNI